MAPQPHPTSIGQFDQAVRGIADAADRLDTPVISGNVSFYNQSELGEVLPTALIGMLGLLNSPEHAITSAPTSPTSLFLLSVPGIEIEQQGLGASAFVAALYGHDSGVPIAPDLGGEQRLSQLLADGAEHGVIQSAHDCSEGGLGVALAEVCLFSGLGGRFEFSSSTFETLSPQGRLFGEFPGWVIVGCENAEELHKRAQWHDIRVEPLGDLVDTHRIEVSIGTESFQWDLSDLRSSYEESLPRSIGR